MKYIKVILFILVLSWAMSVVAQDKEKNCGILGVGRRLCYSYCNK